MEKVSVKVCWSVIKLSLPVVTAQSKYDLHYRFSADFDWCIRIMKQSKILHNTHLTLIDYLNEGMTTRNHKASLKERFRIMCKHYGYVSTVMRHLWFALRTDTSQNNNDVSLMVQ